MTFLKQTCARKNSDTRNQQGFTLLEVMLATLIFVFAFLPIVDLYSSALAGSEDSENLTLALQSAQSRMEEFMLLEYDDLLVGTQKAELLGLPLFENVVLVDDDIPSKTSLVIQCYYVDAINNKASGDMGLKLFVITSAKKEKNGKYVKKAVLRMLFTAAL